MLLVIQFGTYWAYGQRTMPQACLRQLRDFPGLDHKDFVVVGEESEAAMTPGQRAAFTGFLCRYVPTVYHGMSEVPESRLMTEPVPQKTRDDFTRWEDEKALDPETLTTLRQQIAAGRRVVGYRNGWKVTWQLQASRLFWMHCRATYHEAPTGAEGVGGHYIWVLSFWVPVWTDWGFMS